MTHDGFGNEIVKSRWSILLSLTLIIGLGMIWSPRLSGQGATAAMNGTVLDPSGLAVAGAKVTLKNLDTSTQQDAVTNVEGRYVFVALKPGRYSLLATKQGFEVSTTPDITLAVDQTLTQDLKLQVGASTENVTVEAAEVSVDTTTNELGTAIETKEVTDLPLNGRNFTQLLALTPGVSPISTGQNSGGGGGFAGNAIGSFTFPSVNGQTNRSNMFLLDGFSDYGFIGNYAMAPIVDAIQEFKVQSHNDSSAFGGSLGGIINVVTKGGSAQYHGDVWEFLRNSALDARNTFNTSVTPYKQNQFGAAGGGPVIPGIWRKGTPKTFFFASYEGFRAIQSAEDREIVPTTDQLSGNFTSSAVPIYNPFTTAPDPANPGEYTRQQFDYLGTPNVIDPTLINQGLVAYAKAFYPTVTALPVNGFNFTDTTPNVTHSNGYSIRGDQQFTDQLMGWVKFAKSWEPTTSATGIPGVLSVNSQDAHQLGGSVTWSSPSGNKIISGRFGRTYAMALTQDDFPSSLVNAWQTGGFNTLYATGYQGGRSFNPGQYFNDYAGIPDGVYQGNEIADIYEGAADVTLVKGKHTLQGGMDLNTNNNSQPILFVNQTYSSYQTSDLESTAATGDDFASYLLGLPTSVNRRNVAITTHGGWVNGFYAQDQWKVNSKLQLNLGVRYDITLWPIYGDPNAGTQFVGDTDLDTGQYIMAKVPPGCTSGASPCIPTPDGSLPANVVVTQTGNGSIIHNTKDNWQPRVGISYQVKPGTVIRMAGGKFFDNWAAIQQLATNYQGNWPDTNFLLKNNLNTPYPDATTGQNPLGLGSSGSQILPAPTPFNQVNWMIDPYYKNAYSVQWNFGIEQQLGNGTVLEGDYVGSHSSRLDSGSYRNTALTPGPGPLTTYDGNGNLITEGTRQPYGYITPTYFDKSVANSNYHAFQFKARSKLGNDLTVLGAYTFSKIIDVGCDGFFGSEGCSVQDPYHLRADRSVAGYNIPQLLSVSYVYELPVGKGKLLNISNPVTDSLLGGWNLSGIFSARSGQPFNTTASGDIPNTGNVVERGDRGSTCNPYTSTKGRNYLNTNGCFTTPQPFTYGNEGRNDLISPRVINWDMSLMKDFGFGEERKAEFRTDFFNAANHQSLGVADSGLNDSTFGQILGTAQTEREIQFALKIYF